MMRLHPHIGRLIDARLKEIGMSKAEFGRRISTSRQNVSLLLQRQSFQTEQLLRIGRVLDWDFFQYLSPKREKNSREIPFVYMMVAMPNDPDKQRMIVEYINSIS